MFFFFLILTEIVILAFIDYFAIGIIYKFEPISANVNEILHAERKHSFPDCFHKTPGDH